GEGAMKLARREFLHLTAGAAALTGGAHSAAAAVYPDRPIRLVLPFPPGGVFDIVGRPWAGKVKASLGSVFVDNQPGAAARWRRSSSPMRPLMAIRFSSAPPRSISLK